MHTHLVDRPGDTADLSRVLPATLEITLLLDARSTRAHGGRRPRDVSNWQPGGRIVLDEIDVPTAPLNRIQAAGLARRSGEARDPSSRPRRIGIPPQVRMGVARGAAEFRRKAEEVAVARTC